ncbi:hypothetical protein L2E82_22460 [Cichorium intybus]|uniref:Uncharacterized protein n=1 Tax=Cichorium intybus TaxID=13427 RepID=A0ACB9DYS9_CICIN|nr:hypothetical protein L2E82_22460 [Cichorium intybus]
MSITERTDLFCGSAPTTYTQPVGVPSSGPNLNPLDLVPQGLPDMGTNAPAGNLEFLLNSPQSDGSIENFRNILRDLHAAMPQVVTVTPKEREAIELLEAMGFDRAFCPIIFDCASNLDYAYSCYGTEEFAYSIQVASYVITYRGAKIQFTR